MKLKKSDFVWITVLVLMFLVAVSLSIYLTKRSNERLQLEAVHLDNFLKEKDCHLVEKSIDGYAIAYRCKDGVTYRK